MKAIKSQFIIQVVLIPPPHLINDCPQSKRLSSRHMAHDHQKQGSQTSKLFLDTRSRWNTHPQRFNASIQLHGNHLGGVCVVIWWSYKNQKGKKFMFQKNFHSSINTNAFLHLSAHYDYSFERQSCCGCSLWCSYSCIQQLQVLEGQQRSQWHAILAVACCQVLHACFLHFIFISLFSRKIDIWARRISSTWRILSYSRINRCTMFFSPSRMSTMPLLKQHSAWLLPRATKLLPTSAVKSKSRALHPQQLQCLSLLKTKPLQILQR